MVRGDGRKEPPYKLRMHLMAPEKRQIARVAEGLIGDSDLVFLDVGSTCLELAKLLGRRNITVVTHWLPNMIELARGEQCEIFNTGGRINGGELCSVGVTAFNSVGNFLFDKAFLGVAGLASDELSDFVVESVEIKKRVLERAREVIVLADDTKFERQAPVRIASLSAINKIVVCDLGRIEERAQNIRSKGIEIIGINGAE